MSKPARQPVWKSIARDLTEDLAQARYAPGDKLPTEAQLAARFGVNRHTVRRALGEMAELGLVHARRGAGVFVAPSATSRATSPWATARLSGLAPSSGVRLRGGEGEVEPPDAPGRVDLHLSFLTRPPLLPIHHQATTRA